MNNLSNVLEDYSHCNLMGYDLKTLHRLWSRIIIPKDYENDCWLWTAGTDDNGYGYIHFLGKRYRSPRVIYECYNGPIPEGLLIRHTCDNPPCVSPYHLKTGTDYDNIHDAIDRGRFAYGENNGRSLLTENDVKDILNYLWEGNITCVELGKMYDVHSTTINQISLGKVWKKIYNQLTKDQKEKIKFNTKNNKGLNSSPLIPDQVKQIRKLYVTTNMKQIDLARMFGVNRQVIYKITTGKSWKHI
jgi:DNA-binding XRE family transcriptional regulator